MKVCYIISTPSVAGGANRSLLDLIHTEQKLDPMLECIALMSAHGSMEQALAAEGVKCHVIPFANGVRYKSTVKTWGKIVYNCFARGKLRQLFRNEKVDLVHNNSLPTTLGMEVARQMGIPYLCHIRENVWTGLGMEFYAPKTVKTAIEQAECAVTISEFIKQSYLSFAPGGRYRVLPDGIRIGDYYTPDRSILAGETVRLLMVGAINPQKGQREAVAAVERLLARGRRVRLTIVGAAAHWNDSTEYADTLMDFVAEHGLEQVEFLPPIDDLEELKALRSACDINLICSRAEGLGRTTIESMLSGALTIAADAGATPEIVTDRETGLLYPCEDVPALAQRIEWAMDHPEEARAIAVRGQVSARERFDIEGYAEAILSLYREIGQG